MMANSDLRRKIKKRLPRLNLLSLATGMKQSTVVSLIAAALVGFITKNLAIGLATYFALKITDILLIKEKADREAKRKEKRQNSSKK